ncbi:MAG: hypothetical protein AVDCRST_MAG86-953 [uncultured Truepera sp.]|uniref:Uncharacterized protein n=1 Tax=uncultured Truepera sp. TaxID=543023 RepID=A0A6J4UXA4_9DEIN|nr:MAG: hypothetical protein AVDCRST_MAG86-953 [uncultured Truepera sp.]
MDVSDAVLPLLTGDVHSALSDPSSQRVTWALCRALAGLLFPLKAPEV